MKKFALLSVILCSWATSPLGFAQTLDKPTTTYGTANGAYGRGGVASGGGSQGWIDGELRPADSLFASSPTQKTEQIQTMTYEDFPLEIRIYMDHVFDFLKNLRVSASTFKDDYIMAKGNRYFLVPVGRNAPCEQYVPHLQKPVKDHQQYGCTFQNDTYLFLSQWTNPANSNSNPRSEQALNLRRTRALELIHERLWAAFPQADQKDIAAFVGSLDKFLHLYDQQMKSPQTATELPAQKLKEIEVDFKAFYSAALTFGFVDKSYISIFQTGNYKVASGGGLILRCPEAVQINRSVIGIGSVIYSTCGAEPTIISNSRVIGTGIVGATPSTIQDSLLVDSWVEAVDLKSTQALHSQLNSVRAVQSRIEGHLKNSELIESQFSGRSVGRLELFRTFMKDSAIGGNDLRGSNNIVAKIRNSKVTDVQYAENATVESADLSNSLFGKLEIRGTPESRVVIKKTGILVPSIIEAGASIDDVGLGFGTEKFVVAAGASVSQFHLDTEWLQMKARGTRSMSIDIGAGARVQNVKASMALQCPQNALTVGPGRTVDLGGQQRQIDVPMSCRLEF